MTETNGSRTAKHTLTLEDRGHLHCTGVLDVGAYDEHTVSMKTGRGRLTVEGEGLHVRHLALESGELTVEGTVTGLYYTEDAPGASGGFFARLLR